MSITINSPGWKLRARSRGTVADTDLGTLPDRFLAADARIAEEAVIERTVTREGSVTATSDQLDISFDVAGDRRTFLAVRHASGALTFHLPVQTGGTRGARTAVRFQIVTRAHATRGLVSQAIKAILVEVRKIGTDKIVGVVLPKLARVLESSLWDRAGRKEGWHAVSKGTLDAGTLTPAVPTSPERSLLFLHGTFSHAAAAYKSLAASTLFDRLAPVYSDRIFAFDHFTVSRTPEENAKMLLQSLPDQSTTFDVVTHSRGGLVLRNLVERRAAFGDLANRFQLRHAVLVASPNAGTPLATPKRWEDTLGWFANLMELFPDNPFTTGAEFVANGLVWIANHASGDLPGIHAMDGDGDLIADLQRAPGPDAAAYSALVSNYQPDGNVLLRLADCGLDQFFGSANDLVVPSEGGWMVDDLARGFIPASRIGCFGPGGNLEGPPPTHVGFFTPAASADFIVEALTETRHPRPGVDPRKTLPTRRLLRGGALDGPGRTRVATTAAPAAATTPPLEITVTHGNLTFEPEALLIGHYTSTNLAGAEGVIDTLIGGAMRHSLDLGLYPRECGSHQIFVNRRIDLEHGFKIPRPKAVIVAGLGQEGSLGSADLVRTVRQAVIAWSQRLFEKRKTPPTFDLSSTLIGSGGAGITAAEAARLIAQGVAEANDLLAGDQDKARWPRAARLKLVELYLDRATDAWRALKVQQDATAGRLTVNDIIVAGTGGIQRPPETGYRGAAYDFISIESRGSADGDEISFTLDTRRARSEVRGKKTQSALLRDLIREASDDAHGDERIGESLFNLLVPMELEAYLAGKGELQLQLTPSLADVPWELLNSRGNGQVDERPWAIRTRLLRKLALQGAREVVVDANADESALVIGEPECPPDKYSRLYGAHEEAAAVRDCLCADTALGSTRVTALVSKSETETGYGARDIISSLYERPWRILHIAGHGAPADPATGSPGGVVLSNNTFLGPAEIESMRVVPELVFVNCCHLARGDERALLNPRYDRVAFASGIAQELIRIGVKAVIAAGWAVDDDAASAFARTFYASLLSGARLIDAVGRAREEAWQIAPASNTWAAYQCYGDPDWKFRRRMSDPNRGNDAAGEFDTIASETALDYALRRVTVESKHQGADPAAQVARLHKLEELYASRWTSRHALIHAGVIADRFGEAFVEAGDLPRGIEWYERALVAEDGTASLKAAEQLCNARARLAWQLVDHACAHRDAMELRAQARGLSAGARRAAQRAAADANRKCTAATRRARTLLDSTDTLLTRLRALDETMERASLAGSIQKRRALIATVSGGKAPMATVLKKMRDEYATAARLGQTRDAIDVYYPVFNRLVADVALGLGGRRGRAEVAEGIQQVRALLEAKGKDADFWSLVGEIELNQLVAVSDRTFPRKAGSLRKDFEALHVAVQSRRKWEAVYDTATLVFVRYRSSLGSARDRRAVDETLQLLRGYAHSDVA